MGLSVTSTLTVVGSAEAHAHTLRYACEPIRMSSNTVKNIYTLLHQSMQTNELLTNEPTHTHRAHCNASISHTKDVTSVLTTIKQYVL